jgi:adenylosuccinate synthase
MALDVLLGLQWGDEGKGKIVDFLATRYNAILRFQGGPNAGHTLVFGGKKYVLHTIPSGIYHPNLTNVIGNGVVIDPTTLKRECEEVVANGVDVKKQLLIAKKAHLIIPTHRLLDKLSEQLRGDAKIGSTLKGIGPAYMDKTGRNGLRIGDMLQQDFKIKYEALKLKHLEIVGVNVVDFDLVKEEKLFWEGVEYLKKLTCIDAEYWVNEQLDKGQNILAEGAQGTMLDIDFGTYPYVTSSSTLSGGVCIGIGVAPNKIRKVIGITKAYCTRVGSGPFVSELHDEVGEQLRKAGNEFGSTTGRPRRCGWIDLVALKYACMINGVTQLVVTKVDVLNEFDELKACHSYTIDNETVNEIPFEMNSNEIIPNYKTYKGWMQVLQEVKELEQLPFELQIFIKMIEKEMNIPIMAVSMGAERNKLLVIE